MKKLVVLLLSALCLSGCGKDDWSPVELSANELTTSLSKTIGVKVNGGSGEYSARIDNPEIADVSITPDYGYGISVEIVTKSEGEAIITVTDTKSGFSAQCALTVRANETGMILRDIRFAVDADQKELIEADLRDNPPYPTGSRIVWQNQSPTDKQWTVTNPENTVIESGTVTMQPLVPADFADAYALMPIDKQIFTTVRLDVDLDAGPKSYFVFVVSDKISRANISFYHYRLYEDLTEEYRAKYPDAGVRVVVRVLYCE